MVWLGQGIDAFVCMLQTSKYGICSVHAECTFTDSFHGSVFLTLYHRPFYISKRLDGDRSGMYGRIETLLDISGIRMEVLTVIDNELWMQNYETAEQRLGRLRSKSMVYLAKVIGDVCNS